MLRQSPSPLRKVLRVLPLSYGSLLKQRRHFSTSTPGTMPSAFAQKGLIPSTLEGWHSMACNGAARRPAEIYSAWGIPNPETLLLYKDRFRQHYVHAFV